MAESFHSLLDGSNRHRCVGNQYSNGGQNVFGCSMSWSRRPGNDIRALDEEHKLGRFGEIVQNEA